VEGRRWALDPANKEEAVGLLAERLKLTPQVAAQAYAVATDPAEGMSAPCRASADQVIAPHSARKTSIAANDYAALLTVTCRGCCS
jgi:hypothetical protein